MIVVAMRKVLLKFPMAALSFSLVAEQLRLESPPDERRSAAEWHCRLTGEGREPHRESHCVGEDRQDGRRLTASGRSIDANGTVLRRRCVVAAY